MIQRSELINQEQQPQSQPLPKNLSGVFHNLKILILLLIICELKDQLLIVKNTASLYNSTSILQPIVIS